MRYFHRSAHRAALVARALTLTLALAACTDGTAPRALVNGSQVALDVDASAALWDVMLPPLLPDEGGVYGLLQSSEAMAISDQGTVVGSSERSYMLSSDTAPCYGSSAFALIKGQMLDLLPHDADGCFWNAGAMDVNSSNVVVGWLMRSGDKEGFVWTPQQGLQSLPSSGDVIDVIARAVNDAGTIVGNANSLDASHALMWINGGYVDLHPAWATNSYALDISDNGVIVGVADGEVVQWLTDGSVVTSGGSVPFLSTAAFGIDRIPIGINGDGVVAYSGRHALLWANPLAPPTKLDAPPRLLADISDLGRIIGSTEVGTWPDQVQVPYTAIVGGPATRLSLPRGYAGVTLNGVNRCGAIVGIAESFTQARRATLWKKRGCD